MNSAGTNAGFSHAPSASSHMPFPARPIKTAPATVNRSDALRERRRNIFLKKVQQNRDDTRWGTRVEDVSLILLFYDPDAILTVE